MASVHEYAIAMLKKIGGYWSFGNEYPEMVQQFWFIPMWLCVSPYALTNIEGKFLYVPSGNLT